MVTEVSCGQDNYILKIGDKDYCMLLSKDSWISAEIKKAEGRRLLGLVEKAKSLALLKNAVDLRVECPNNYNCKVCEEYKDYNHRYLKGELEIPVDTNEVERTLKEIIQENK